MVTINPPTQWMALDLAFRRDGKEVVFAISFTNRADTPQELVFSNRAHKAELLGLRLFNANGERIEPVRKFILQPLPDPDGRRWLQPGESWVYDLKGTVTEEGLDFPATVFPLPKNAPHQARFVYKQVASNDVVVLL